MFYFWVKLGNYLLNLFFINDVKMFYKNYIEEIEWNKWKVKFRIYLVEMLILYILCLEILEV